GTTVVTGQLVPNLSQHEAFDSGCTTRHGIGFDDHAAEADVTGSSFEARRHSAHKFLDNQFLLYSDHAVVWPGHADVGDVCRAFRKHDLIRRGNVRVGADHGSDAAIEVPAERDLLRCGLGVKIDKDDSRLHFFENRVDETERIIARAHEDTPL